MKTRPWKLPKFVRNGGCKASNSTVASENKVAEKSSESPSSALNEADPYNKLSSQRERKSRSSESFSNTMAALMTGPSAILSTVFVAIVSQQLLQSDKLLFQRVAMALTFFGLNFSIRSWFQCKLDSTGEERRRQPAAIANDQDDEHDTVRIKESYWVNDRGMCLFTTTMLPKHNAVQSVLCYCHALMEHTLRSTDWKPEELAQHGIACVSIQYEGHGRSDGPLNFIPNWNDLVEDVASFCYQMAERKRFQGKPVFLVGKSTGCLVAYSVSQKLPYLFRGTIFLKSEHQNFERRIPWGARILCTLLRLSQRLMVGSSSGDYDVRSWFLDAQLITALVLDEAKSHSRTNLRNFDNPFLVLAAERDLGFGKQLYDGSYSRDKSIIIREEHEDGGEMELIADWIIDRSS